MSYKISLVIILLLCLNKIVFAQLDTSYLYNPAASYGPLDIRIATSPEDYYYIEEGKTFSFREVNGVRTNTYLDMTAWDSDPYTQGQLRAKVQGEDKHIMNFRLLSPSAYSENYPQGYPLVILLHGSLERGNCSGSNCYHATSAYSPNTNEPQAPRDATHELLNNDYNLVHGGSNYLEAYETNGNHLPDDAALPARAFPGFVVVPQNLNGWDEFAAEDAIRLVRLMIKKYNIDESRIYINGVSNGGHGTYEVIKRAPWLFAAAVLFSAADDASIISQKAVSNIVNIPLWIFQGGVDQKPTVRQTEGYVKHFRNVGMKVRYTLYPQIGHGTWNKAFDEPDFFSWMLRQRKNNIHIFGEQPIICKTSGEGALLSLPKGYASYQWEFDGTIMSTENSSSLVANQVGSYRGRYQRTEQEWSEWSEAVIVNEKNLPPIAISQIGTVLLKDPNGNNNATIEADANYEKYFWYRNGSLINFSGDQDDTVRVAMLSQQLGDGVYHMQASGFDNCKTAPSEAKRIIFNDRAPISITSPSQLEGKNESPSSVALTWEDLSDNETGFEIWRRQKISANEFGLWIMTSITTLDVKEFKDNNLLPSATYQYIIRAVSETARSEYHPDVMQPLEITTLADNDPPSIPLSLHAELSGIGQANLTWEPANDNSSISHYLIQYNEDTISTAASDTSFVLRALAINTLYEISIKAIDVARNASQSSNTISISTEVNGLYYQHSTGAWNTLEEIDWSIAEFTGVVSNFTMQPKTQEDFFNFRFDGYLNLEQDGVYQFRISSDDGSRMMLDDSLLIENDGIHNFATTTAPIQIMEAGPHRITVDFFDFTQSDSLLVEYKGPDSENEWVKIPSSALRSTLITSVEEPDSYTDISVFPNPFDQTGLLHIELTENIKSPVFVTLSDALGKRVIIALEPEGDTERRYSIKVTEHLKPGMYFLLVDSKEKTFTRKLIINE